MARPSNQSQCTWWGQVNCPLEKTAVSSGLLKESAAPSEIAVPLVQRYPVTREGYDKTTNYSEYSAAFGTPSFL